MLFRELAAQFINLPHDPPHSWQDIKDMRAEVDAQFRAIPLPVEWHNSPDEPYNSLEELTADINAGRFKVKATYFNSPVWPGWTYPKFRAVHDYFDHYEHQFPFTIKGEYGSFGTLVARFSPQFWPFLYNEIVLANCYFVANGERHNHDKIVRPVAPLIVGK